MWLSFMITIDLETDCFLRVLSNCYLKLRYLLMITLALTISECFADAEAGIVVRTFGLKTK